MSVDELVVLRGFATHIEAELARTALEAAGIESMIRADDCAGLQPAMTPVTGGALLLVHPEDLDAALEVLDDTAEVVDDDRRP